MSSTAALNGHALPFADISVRRFFTNVVAAGGSISQKYDRWQPMTVDRFFLMISKPTAKANLEQAPCDMREAENIMSLLDDFNWD